MLIGVSALVLGTLIAIFDPFRLILKWVSHQKEKKKKQIIYPTLLFLWKKKITQTTYL